MDTLTLQIYLDYHWHDACELVFPEPHRGRAAPCEVSYLPAYVANFGDRIEARVSLEFPLDYFPHQCGRWPAFLHDIMPMGAARRFWLKRKALPVTDAFEHDFLLLKDCCAAPIGNIRVKESVVRDDIPPAQRFSLNEILQRDSDFLDYASEVGAGIGGATGAGGEAPKFLLSEDQQKHYFPEATLDDDRSCAHYLVKFPRNNAGKDDHTLLEAEAVYYKLACAIGFNTIDITGLRFFPQDSERGIQKASLWLPRFDRNVIAADDGFIQKRWGMESLYSLTGVTEPGATKLHTDYLQCLAQRWRDADQEAQIPQLFAEYLSRDLLNVVLGNTDNHGRNTSILKQNNQLVLAPVYDLAPMFFDPEGIVRTSRWRQWNELGGQFDWLGICAEAASIEKTVEADWLWQTLRDVAVGILAIPDLASDYGLPSELFNHNKLRLGELDQKLKRWDLL